MVFFYEALRALVQAIRQGVPTQAVMPIARDNYGGVFLNLKQCLSRIVFYSQYGALFY